MVTDQTEDQLELMRLKSRFCRFADDLDIDGMLSHFTADVRARYTPDGEVVVGQDALREFYESEVGRTVASLHLVGNFEIEFTSPDTAELRCGLHSWKRFVDEAGDRDRYARYVDTWVRTEEGWKQSELTYIVIGETGTRPPRRGLENLSAELREAREHLR